MEPGTLLADRYRLERPVGAGGMGQVWAARDEVLGREVAVKVQAVDGGTSQELERFRREARAAAGLGHPNVVTIFDAGIDGGTAFLVMELLPGPDLAAYVAQRGMLPESEAVAVAEQVAAGLAAAHAAGVVHRDIKPANVMFHGPGTVKILDFGIARLAHTSAARLTATNTLVGSTPYLSPEQVEGRPGDERSDIYALGCVLMTMLTGRPPFEGDHPLAVMHQHASSVAPRLRERRPEVSASLDQLVSEMLAKSPDDRPATCQALIARLRDVGRTAVASPAGGVGPAGGAVAVTRVMASPARSLAGRDDVPKGPPSVAGRPAPLRIAAAVAGAALLVAIVAMAQLNRPEGEAQSPPSAATPSVTTTPSTTATSSATATPSSTPARSTPAAVARTQQSSPSSAPSAAAQEPTSTPAEATLSRALAGLRAAVEAETAGGTMDEKKSEELVERVDELDEKLGEDTDEDDKQDKQSKQSKEIQDVEKYLGELTAKGELSAEGSQRIGAALAEVRAAL